MYRFLLGSCLDFGLKQISRGHKWVKLFQGHYVFIQENSKMVGSHFFYCFDCPQKHEPKICANSSSVVVGYSLIGRSCSVSCSGLAATSQWSLGLDFDLKSLTFFNHSSVGKFVWQNCFLKNLNLQHSAMHFSYTDSRSRHLNKIPHIFSCKVLFGKPVSTRSSNLHAWQWCRCYGV